MGTCQTRSKASISNTLFPRTTTIPIVFLVCALTTSTQSSITRFMNGSKPRRIPVTLRLPFNLRESLRSMYFFNSGGLVFDIVLLLLLLCCLNISDYM